ncbi:MAG: hypothetical protein IIA67_10915, partial [Planctomycetes bacterium]|nr:hypothetical protein [Planctomycetota bacterium]
MFRRLGWIVASYATRPLILALVAGGLLFASITWFAKRHTIYVPNYPVILGPQLLVDSKATLEAVRREGRQDEVDGINLNALWADIHLPKEVFESPRPREVEFQPPGEAFFRILEEFPNLRNVAMTFYGKTTGV